MEVSKSIQRVTKYILGKKFLVINKATPKAFFKRLLTPANNYIFSILQRHYICLIKTYWGVFIYLSHVTPHFFFTMGFFID